MERRANTTATARRPNPALFPRMRVSRGVAALVAAAALSGCSTVNGLWADATGTGDYSTASIAAPAQLESGVAAWDGDVSAPGMTAAHPRLAPGSWARVTNTGTGQSAVVRIDRRMAPMRGRNIELSRDAAAAVGALQQGVAPVLIEPIDPRQASPAELTAQPVYQPAPPSVAQTPVYTPPPPVTTARYEPAPPPRAAAPSYDPNLATATIPGPNVAYRPAQPRSAAPFDPHYLQLGSFRDRANAERLAAQVRDRSLGAGAYGDAFVETAYVGGSVYHRVRLGPLESRTLADRALRDARTLGHSSATILKP